MRSAIYITIIAAVVFAAGCRRHSDGEPFKRITITRQIGPGVVEVWHGCAFNLDDGTKASAAHVFDEFDQTAEWKQIRRRGDIVWFAGQIPGHPALTIGNWRDGAPAWIAGQTGFLLKRGVAYCPSPAVGDSGSPVIRADTGEVVGVFSSYDVDAAGRPTGVVNVEVF
jgi:hypothetical protein